MRKRVREIRELVLTGVPTAELARRYGVSRATIYRELNSEKPEVPPSND